jgi:hypothetical protein
LDIAEVIPLCQQNTYIDLLNKGFLQWQLQQDQEKVRH